jgi:CRISPR/Cas system-associated exonuclease Cas4 (RecB family)
MSSEFTLDFDAIFNAFIEANQKAWAHDRGTTLGASEVFDCLRKGWFSKRGAEFGHEPDEDYDEDWGALTRGNLIENHHVVPAVRDHMPDGIVVEYAGDEQVTLVLDRNSATPDGLITGLPKGCKLRVKGGTQDIVIDDIVSDCVVLEIKSIDPRATLMEERNKHHGQTQVQLGLFHEKTEWRPYYSIVLYIDASFLSKVTPFVVKYDPNIYAEAKQRATDVWNITDPMDIMPEGRFSGACEHCKWKRACGTAQVSAIPKFDEDKQSTPETIAEMDTRVQKFFKDKAAFEAAERSLEISKERIRELLMSRNTRKMKSGGWSVSWYGQPGRKTYDMKAMEADGINIADYQKDGTPFDVVRVTPRLEKAKE